MPHRRQDGCGFFFAMITNSNFSDADDTGNNDTNAMMQRAASSPSSEIFVGEMGSGSFVPGQRRPHEPGRAAGKIDAAADATQTEQSERKPHSGGDAGCVAPGDPAHRVDSKVHGMNQHRVPNADKAEGRRQNDETGAHGVTRPTKRRLTTAQIEHGQLCLAKWEAVRAYRAEQPAADWKKVRKETGVSAVEFCRWNKALRAGHQGWATEPPR